MKIISQLLGLAVIPAMTLAAPVDFTREVQPIFQNHCYDCHGPKKQRSGFRLDQKAAALKGGLHHAPDILPGDATNSPLLHLVTHADPKERMPKDRDALSPEQIDILTRWIKEGAAWPDDVAETHWSFEPIQAPVPPKVKQTAWPRDDLDHFILNALEKKALSPAPEADRVTWLRRVTFDLTGLPPTPEEVAAFLSDASSDPFEKVVDRLLASPRYGERWAQHWLDVVRFADTHGFEVNTERPNAWPYRDYVIRAFNQDIPYDRFIREQIAGDATGEDAATGFLVTASVLLPGQIGKDAPSIRLARQDSLDEIVVNIGQTFMGLSIGCARCHDHMFDPISQEDYYAMQAFVAGVEYADRPLRTKEAETARQETEKRRARLTAIDGHLARFVAPARVGRKATPPPSPKINTEVFEPIEARFVRFSIHDANLHPTLGLIGPCIDEFEIFAGDENLALASRGAKVTASPSWNSAKHKIEHINDGRYGNSYSWVSSEHGRGWIQVELPEPARIDKVIWGRDREGQFQDRLATMYTLEAGLTPDSLTTLKERQPLRPSLHPGKNTDRFSPVKAKQLRFTILNTMVMDRREPCIDEFEVFNTRGENIALATAGTTVEASGSITEANRHELRFVHDGVYGNSRSWMSNEKGKGRLVLTFPKEQMIDRVVWGRDREGQFKDRLATRYLVETCDASGTWTRVADSEDRHPFVEGKEPAPTFTLAGLNQEDKVKAEALMKERAALQKRINAKAGDLLVFAGKFRKPDDIHLLRRGDPEQPQHQIAPSVPKALGDRTLAPDADEQARRQTLADWIARPDHPLTARVMVNRIWQGHFGAGLVDTSSDFGQNGAQPSHPDLLDRLARDFIDSGWSIKDLHRRIVRSATYRQSGTFNAVAAEQDADARLLWRFPPRRLEGEAIRDGMLAVSGRLDLKMYGRGYDLFDKRGGLTGFKPVDSFKGEGLRRMVYAHKVRRERDAVFGSFDCPDAGQSAPRRRESTTPIQALSLFNSRFTLEESEAFATRVKQDAGEKAAAQVRRAYELALNRPPSEEELQDAERLVQTHGPAVLCRALFNCNEFLFLP